MHDPSVSHNPPALGLLLGDFQPFPPPQPLHALVIHRPALPTQQPRNPPIALPPILRRQRDDPGHHRLCFVLCAKALEEDERSWQRLIAEIDLLTKEQSHDHSSQA